MTIQTVEHVFITAEEKRTFHSALDLLCEMETRVQDQTIKECAHDAMTSLRCAMFWCETQKDLRGNDL